MELPSINSLTLKNVINEINAIPGQPKLDWADPATIYTLMVDFKISVEYNGNNRQWYSKLKRGDFMDRPEWKEALKAHSADLKLSVLRCFLLHLRVVEEFKKEGVDAKKE